MTPKFFVSKSFRYTINKIVFLSLSLSLFFQTEIIYPQPVSWEVIHPSWSYNKTIYEVNIRQYTKSGTFKDFEKHLPELEKMGVGILWLMPVNPIGVKNRKGKLGSYYSVKDYLAVNPEFGTMDDFKELINTIHSLDMYVIIDWVADHTSWDNALTREHPDFYKKDPDGNFVPPVKDWTDVIGLDYKNKALWKYMIDALKFWVKDCGVDGFRCDVADMVPTAFWEEARNELDKIKPVFMLAEAEKPGLQVKAFDMTYSWQIYQLMNGIALDKINAPSIYKYLNGERMLFPKNDFRMRFITNHDENSWNGSEFERMGDAVPAFTALTFVIPGMPLIYNGQEVGLTKRLKFFEKDTIDWKNSTFRELYTKLINLKAKNKALWSGDEGGDINFVSTTKDTSILAFIREKDNNKVFVIFNLYEKPVEQNLTSSAIKGNYLNWITGEKASFSEIESFKLEPWEYLIFVKE